MQEPTTTEIDTILLLGGRIFRELGMHHHYQTTTDSFKKLPLEASGAELYWNFLDAHNFTMLAITFCKVMEFHKAYRHFFPQLISASFDAINKRLVSAEILLFRNKFSGHLFDNSTGQPLSNQELQSYANKLYNGQTKEDFRRWWWSQRDDPLENSIAGNFHLLNLYFANRRHEA